MAKLFQCDRCGYQDRLTPENYLTVELDGDRSWEICVTCVRALEHFMEKLSPERKISV